LAGGKKIDILKLAKKRDDALKKANAHFLKMRALEKIAENTDAEIVHHCDHPKKYLKLKNFSDTQTFWLCTICFNTVLPDQVKKDKITEESIKDLFNEIWDEIPSDWAE
jgi:rubrerythrin